MSVAAAPDWDSLFRLDQYWCQGFGVEVQLPFDCVTIIAIYLSQCFQQFNSTASLTLVYSAIK